MKRELGIARCGLACCLCSENVTCGGCDSGDCPDKDGCENRACSMERGLSHCFACEEGCRKGLLGKIKLRVYPVRQTLWGGGTAGLPGAQRTEGRSLSPGRNLGRL